jgi:hypothetical protein
MCVNNELRCGKEAIVVYFAGTFRLIVQGLRRSIETARIVGLCRSGARELPYMKRVR